MVPKEENLELSVRDKVVQKMTRDGAAEENLSHGGIKRISGRLEDGKFTGPGDLADMDIQYAVRGINVPETADLDNAVRHHRHANESSQKAFSDSGNSQAKGNERISAADGINERNMIHDAAEQTDSLEEELQATSLPDIRSSAPSGSPAEKFRHGRNKRMAAEKAGQKLRHGRNSGMEGQSSVTGNPNAKTKPGNKLKGRKSRLRFGDTLESAAEKPCMVLRNTAHEKIDESDDNAAVEAAHRTEENAEYALSDVSSVRKVKDAKSTAAEGGIKRKSRLQHESGRSKNSTLMSDKPLLNRRIAYDSSHSKLKFDVSEKAVSANNKLADVSVRNKAASAASSQAKDKHENDAYFGYLSNVQSKNKQMQKKQLKREYAKSLRNSKRGISASGAAFGLGNKSAAAEATSEKAKEAIKTFFAEHKAAIIAAIGFFLLLIVMLVSIGSVSTMLFSGGEAFVQSSYRASDDAITSTNDTYGALEDELQYKIQNIPNTCPGYDEYRYDLDTIKYDPYVLTSYLTALYGEYDVSTASDELKSLFNSQYILETQEIIEVRTRTVTDADGNEYEEEYDWYVLEVTLRNNGLENVVNDRMTEDQKKSYDLYQTTLGNRSYLFGDTGISGGTGSAGHAGLDYEVPAEALNDAQFAGMIQEAEKYLGYPYVWGGSDPSTSFDCSGFVSWVINNSGNGWNVGRSTANGLRSYCTKVTVPKAGDLIFFQGTYDTPGASHVGIVVDPENKIMIHCGKPIQYASYDTAYWNQHFLEFGRIK